MRGFDAPLARLLDGEGCDVIGEAGTVRTAIALVRLLRPRVVLLDVVLPDLDGFAVAERLALEEGAPSSYSLRAGTRQISRRACIEPRRVASFPRASCPGSRCVRWLDSRGPPTAYSVRARRPRSRVGSLRFRVVRNSPRTR